MRIIGKRKIRSISNNASGELLKQGALFNDELHKLPTGQSMLLAKGIYRYSSHDEANRHWDDCIIEKIVRMPSDEYSRPATLNDLKKQFQ